VHRQLGPGLFESSYEACLAHELVGMGLRVARQVALPITYKDTRIEEGYRVDLIVEDTVVVELKAVKSIEPIHEAQLLTYLRLSGHRVGLLLNFNVTAMKNGITRRIL
jgi:GxxExxY protein